MVVDKLKNLGSLQGLIAHDAVRGCDWTALKSARDLAAIIKKVIPNKNTEILFLFEYPTPTIRR